jgi:hypothetical protein
MLVVTEPLYWWLQLYSSSCTVSERHVRRRSLTSNETKSLYIHSRIYRVIKKSLCTWLLQYRKLQVMFKMSPANLQTFTDTPKCVLEDCVQYSTVQRLRWSRGCVLAFSTQVRGFKLSRSRRIFQGEKILSTTSFGGKVKPSVRCRRFAACKRSLK